MKVIETTDGKFAIVERTQVSYSVAIWSPVDDRRFATKEAAESAMWKLKRGFKKEPVIEKPKVVIDRSHLPSREDLRITKLEKGVFVVEQRKFGKWEEIKSFKTRTKAERWCAENSKF